MMSSPQEARHLLKREKMPLLLQMPDRQSLSSLQFRSFAFFALHTPSQRPDRQSLSSSQSLPLSSKGVGEGKRWRIGRRRRRLKRCRIGRRYRRLKRWAANRKETSKAENMAYQKETPKFEKMANQKETSKAQKMSNRKGTSKAQKMVTRTMHYLGNPC